MRKIVLILYLLAMAACSSKSVQTDDGVIDDAPTVMTSAADAPGADEDVKEKTVIPEPPKVVIPTSPSQYAALNEAIKLQNDERIYQTSTQILAQAGNDAKALNALAMYHYKRGRYDLCRYLLKKAIAGNPKMAELHSNLGVVQLAQGEKRDAIKSFRKALEINRDEAVAAANVGAIYVQEKDYGKALVVLETAYRKGVRDPRVLNNYAVALAAHRKFEKAEDLYKTVLKDGNNNKEALFNYAVLLVDNMGKFQEGLEIINRLKFVGGPADTRNRIIALENKAKAGLK